MTSESPSRRRISGANSSVAELPPAEQIDLGALAESWAAGEYDLICVLGPTASGKTKCAVHIAKVLGNCEILSADSRQIYKGMDIGTGKDLCEYDDIPYHLIDIVPAGTKYNVYEFKQAFTKAYEDIRSRGRIPILCGGTGMYINAVTGGYDFQTSKPLSEAGSMNGEGTPALRTYFIGTLVDRDTRNARIDARLEARLKEGMIDEIKGLMAKGVPAEDLIYYGLEYKFVTRHVIGELSYEEMYTQLATAIHQFAKRQMTWFRGMERSGVKIHWTTPEMILNL